MPIKLVLTDDHPLAITGIKTMLSSCPGIVVTETYDTAASLMEGLEKAQPDILPDVILLDILLPDQSGRDLVPLIVKKYPSVRIIALTSLDAPAIIKNMMHNGCKGYLLKNAGLETLVKAIEQVHKGEEFIQPELKENLLKGIFRNSKKPAEAFPTLTQREKEILELIVAECTTQEIADKLFISHRTAETHRYSLLQKLGVKNTAGLVKMAFTLGLVNTD